jgi:hypothetical protein
VEEAFEEADIYLVAAFLDPCAFAAAFERI